MKRLGKRCVWMTREGEVFWASPKILAVVSIGEQRAGGRRSWEGGLPMVGGWVVGGIQGGSRVWLGPLETCVAFTC